MTKIEWPALMRAGLHGLGLAPDVFWDLTPAELHIMLGDPAKQGPLLKSGLHTLMDAYPDKTRGPRDDG